MKYLIQSLCCVVILCMTGCSALTNTEESMLSDEQFLLGTLITIQIYGTEDKSLLEGSFQIIKEIDQWMSLNIENSSINLINQQAGQGPMSVSQEMMTVLLKAKEYGQLSQGKFDITLEPVVRLWGIGTDEARVPTDSELQEALSHVDYTALLLNEADLTIEMEEGMSIDLGGIGKGYAADLVRDYLETNGIKKAIINLGGNVVVLGEKQENTPFKVGLQNPFDDRNTYFGYVSVSNKTVVTSGVYERNFTYDNVTYHHILDTTTGYPVNNGVAAVSVITDKSIDADALSTVLFTLGIEEGLNLVNSLDQVECIYVDEDSNIYFSDDVEEIFTSTDDAFAIKK